jgi:hypothetical protein
VAGEIVARDACGADEWDVVVGLAHRGLVLPWAGTTR